MIFVHEVQQVAKRWSGVKVCAHRPQVRGAMVSGMSWLEVILGGNGGCSAAWRDVHGHSYRGANAGNVVSDTANHAAIGATDSRRSRNAREAKKNAARRE